jgi:hypothetical protein
MKCCVVTVLSVCLLLACLATTWGFGGGLGGLVSRGKSAGGSLSSGFKNTVSTASGGAQHVSSIVSGGAQHAYSVLSGGAQHAVGTANQAAHRLPSTSSVGQRLGTYAPPKTIGLSPPKLPSLGRGRVPSVTAGFGVGDIEKAGNQVAAAAGRVVNPIINPIKKVEQQEYQKAATYVRKRAKPYVNEVEQSYQNLENLAKAEYGKGYRRPSPGNHGGQTGGHQTQANSSRVGQGQSTSPQTPPSKSGQITINTSPAPISVSSPPADNSSSSGQNPTVVNTPPSETSGPGNVAVTRLGLADNQFVSAQQRSSDLGQVIRRSTGALQRIGQSNARRPTSRSEFQAKLRAEQARRNHRSLDASGTQYEESNSTQQHLDSMQR